MIIGNNFNPNPRKNFENSSFNRNQKQQDVTPETKPFQQPNINNNGYSTTLTLQRIPQNTK